MEPQDQDLLSLPTEVLIKITDTLTGYEKLCLRISCKRFYFILSDPRAWNSLVWKDCRRRDEDFKALRLSLGLSCSYVQNIYVSYNPNSLKFPLSKFIPKIHSCKQVRCLSLIGMPITLSMLEKLLSALPSLYYVNVSVGQKLEVNQIVCAASKIQHLQIVRITETSTVNFQDHTAHIVPLAIQYWRENDYLPPNLEFSVSYISFEVVLGQLTSCDHPAFLPIYSNCSPVAGNMINKYPILKVSLHPSVEIVTCPAKSVCSSCRASYSLVLSPSNDPVSATVYKSSIPSPGLTVSFLPPSIKYLSLAGLKELSSTDLTLLSESCPNLICFDMSGCENALLNLQGLADISSNCSGLAALNLKRIHKVESVASLWEVLAVMKKLRHLALRNCLCVPDRSVTPPSTIGERVSHLPPFDVQSRSRIRLSVIRMNLFSLEIDYSRDKPLPLDFEMLLPALVRVQHLRILTNSSGTVDLTNILPNLPSLTYMAIRSQSSLPQLTLPTDPECYSSLKKICIYSVIPCLEFTAQSEVFKALSQSRSLTHLCLSMTDADHFVNSELSNFRHLCECYVMCRYMPGQQSQALLDAKGICGSVKSVRTSRQMYLRQMQYLDQVEDVRSLFRFQRTSS
ncbi:uncharacterized protein LOC135334462 [Halichondria panicea]|uniref:uncharacterized protein LOC135334462 n=1 Tax=Halichondria panicea TaxID=6063 RepID=UPI00312B3A46